MPVSTIIKTTKTKTQSEELCEQMDELIAQAQEQVKIYANIREDLEVEPGLLKQALSMKLGSREDMKQAIADLNNWKAEVKNDVKSAVSEKKNELKNIRKQRRKALGETASKSVDKTSRKKKSRGRFI